MLKIFRATYENLDILENAYNDFCKNAIVDYIDYKVENVSDTLLFVLFVYYNRGYYYAEKTKKN